jgi:hypothetical protein
MNLPTSRYAGGPHQVAHSQADSPEFWGQSSLRGTYVGYDVAVDRSSKRCRWPPTMDGPELWRSVSVPRTLKGVAVGDFSDAVLCR